MLKSIGRATTTPTKTFIGLTIVGIGVAVYHSYDEIVHYSTGPSTACHINSTLNCAATFPYAHLFGIPLYAFGLVWFPLLLIVSLIMRPKLNRNILLPLMFIGNLFTVYLWYLDLAIVLPSTGAVCPVCISMYLINYVLTAIAFLSS